ncbi:hypothetical protein [Geodermatophilus chilensis]|uniref:hypothetical protein n=1 Tax=Geodermatophilus chilensis TaxID=2035835 RepID=UPI000C267F89|nr:hypothetical protein [Geodermatophilus chilensis]
MASRTKAPESGDRQTQTDESGEVFEVLTEAPNGHRTVHRVRAKDRAAAVKAVTPDLADGTQVLGVAVGGAGLGSGD